VCLEPEVTGHGTGINTDGLPPLRLIALAVNLTMVAAAERHGELIADLAAEGAALGEAKVVWIAGHTAADQARLLGNEADVLPIAEAARFGERQDGLVDASGRRLLFGLSERLRSCMIPGRFSRAGSWLIGGSPIGWMGSKRRKLGLEDLLDALGVVCAKAVLGAQVAVGPQRRIIGRSDGADFCEQAVT
jgi:hypothetical protein